jgi:hypothetical protein
MKLLSYTLVFGGLSSWFSISIGASFGSAIVSLIAVIVVIDMLDFNNSTWRLICNRTLSYDMSVVVLKANISQ